MGLLSGSRGPIFLGPCAWWDRLLALRQGRWLPGHLGGSQAPWGHPPRAAPRRLSQLITPRGRGDDILAPAKTNTAPSKHAGLGKPRALAIHHGSPVGCAGQPSPGTATGLGGAQHPGSAERRMGALCFSPHPGPCPSLGCRGGDALVPSPLMCRGDPGRNSSAAGLSPGRKLARATSRLLQ